MIINYNNEMGVFEMSVISFDDALLDLRDGVVRVVFMKKDGKIREMYATRNPDLVAEFDVVNDRVINEKDSLYRIESMLSQKNNGVIKVYDLFKQDFRSITLSSVYHKDPFDSLPGWITFDVNDPWEKIMKDELSLSDYLNYG